VPAIATRKASLPLEPSLDLRDSIGEVEEHRVELERDVRDRRSGVHTLGKLVASDPPPIHVSRRDRHDQQRYVGVVIESDYLVPEYGRLVVEEDRRGCQAPP
jgi:hypothetical protein